MLPQDPMQSLLLVWKLLTMVMLKMLFKANYSLLIWLVVKDLVKLVILDLQLKKLLILINPYLLLDKLLQVLLMVLKIKSQLLHIYRIVTLSLPLCLNSLLVVTHIV